MNVVASPLLGPITSIRYCQTGDAANASPISAVTERLLSQAELVAKTIEELSCRLRLVMRPEMPEAPALAKAVSPAPTPSDHVRQLETINSRHADSIESLQRIMSRLDV